MGSDQLSIAPAHVKYELSESERRLAEFKKKRHFELGAATEDEILEIAQARSRAQFHYAVYKARMLGLVTPRPCEVCGMLPNQPRRVHGHHDDYNFPLSLRWLCEVHHAEWHGANKPVRLGRGLLLLKADDYIELGVMQLKQAVSC